MSWGDIALKNALKNPDVTISGDSKPAKRQDLSKLLPEGSKHEVKFIRLWSELQGPALIREFRFCKRRWRFDFAHLDSKVAIEIQGGTRNQGRHVRHEGYKADVEKTNEAQRLGWLVHQLTYDMITVNELEKIINLVFSRLPSVS